MMTISILDFYYIINYRDKFHLCCICLSQNIVLKYVNIRFYTMV